MTPYNKGKQLTKCQRGHNDWMIDNSGKRRCRQCRNWNRTQQRNGSKTWGTKSREGDRGPREDTFSRSEIMRARGYGE